MLQHVLWRTLRNYLGISLANQLRVMARRLGEQAAQKVAPLLLARLRLSADTLPLQPTNNGRDLKKPAWQNVYAFGYRRRRRAADGCVRWDDTHLRYFGLVVGRLDTFPLSLSLSLSLLAPPLARNRAKRCGAS